jgi:hypothetical protein
VPAAAPEVAFGGPGDVLLVRVDPDLECLRAAALAAGIAAAELERFFGQFSGVSAPA